MKPFDQLTQQDLVQIRSEIVLNSHFLADYSNTYGIEEKSLSAFFDGYMCYLTELALETDSNDSLEDDEILKLDNINNLIGWYNCYDDFSWIKYREEDLDAWWESCDFTTMERITNYKQTDFADEYGYDEFVVACDEFWYHLSNEEKTSHFTKINEN